MPRLTGAAYETATLDRDISMSLRAIVNRKLSLRHEIGDAELRADSLPAEIRSGTLRGLRIEQDLLADERECLAHIVEQWRTNERLDPVSRADRGDFETRVVAVGSYPEVGTTLDIMPLGNTGEGAALPTEDMVIAGVVAPVGPDCEALLQSDARNGKPSVVEHYHAGCFRRWLNALQEGRVYAHALVNHDMSQVLGSTRSGTLQLRMADEGLVYRISMDPLNPMHVGTFRAVARGDIAGSSLGFKAKQDRLLQDTTRGLIRRELQDVEIFDCSLCPRPAYEKSSARVLSTGQRSGQRRSFPAAALPAPEGRGGIRPDSVRALYGRQRVVTGTPGRYGREIDLLLSRLASG